MSTLKYLYQPYFKLDEEFFKLLFSFYINLLLALLATGKLFNQIFSFPISVVFSP